MPMFRVLKIHIRTVLVLAYGIELSSLLEIPSKCFYFMASRYLEENYFSTVIDYVFQNFFDCYHYSALLQLSSIKIILRQCRLYFNLFAYS